MKLLKNKISILWDIVILTNSKATCDYCESELTFQAHFHWSVGQLAPLQSIYLIEL